MLNVGDFMPSPPILRKRADALLVARVAADGLSVAPVCRADRVMFPPLKRNSPIGIPRPTSEHTNARTHGQASPL